MSNAPLLCTEECAGVIRSTPQLITWAVRTGQLKATRGQARYSRRQTWWIDLDDLLEFDRKRRLGRSEAAARRRQALRELEQRIAPAAIDDGNDGKALASGAGVEARQEA